MQNNNRKHDPPEYWLISYEEEIVIDQPAQDGIVGSSRRIVRRQTGNEVINVHPVIHGIMSLQRGRRNYTMVFAMPIPKKHYDLVMAPSEAERKAAEIADKAEKEKCEQAKVLNFENHSNRVCDCECGTCMFPGTPKHCQDCNDKHEDWKRQAAQNA